MSDAMSPKPAGTWAYLREAFTFRWNLLFLVGGVAGALLSPFPDVVLPLVGALELTYLAGLTAIPRFQAAIDAKVHAARRGAHKGEQPAKTRASLEQTLQGLGPEARARFNALRQRCLDMRTIASGVGGSASGRLSDDLRTPALDQLLWVFLRLLYSQQALQRFLRATNEQEIRENLLKQRERLAAASEGGDQRIVTSLTASIANAELRLNNYQKAVGNAEFVEVELERVEGQIHALTEMSVSHQDPDFITRQVSSVVENLGGMEDTLRDLNALTGMAETLQEPPAILDGALETA